MNVMLFLRGVPCVGERSGEWKISMIGGAEYESFVPSILPPDPTINIDKNILELLITAHSQLTLLDGLIIRSSDINPFASLLVCKDAILSSRIEGKKASVEDVFYSISKNRTNQNVIEIINCIKATEFAIRQLKQVPLNNQLIKEIYTVLNGDGFPKETVSKFRDSQIWVGDTINNALYIPPNPDDVENSMYAFNLYFQNGYILSNFDVLIQAALLYYQFASIMPFSKDNGKINRIITTLLLIQEKILSAPVLCLSDYIEKNRTDIWHSMERVRQQDNYEQWIMLFLEAIYESAKHTIKMLDKLIIMREKNIKAVKNMGRSSKTAMLLFQYLEKNPVLEISQAADALNLSFNAVSDMVNRFVRTGIIMKISGEKRNRIYAYKNHLDVLQDRM